MRLTYTLIVGGCAALLSLSACAQTGSAAGMPGSGLADCSRARNPQNCEARQTALELCKDQRGPARAQCVEDNLPPPDCSKARNPDRCAARQAARAACTGKYGAARRACQREQQPAPAKHRPPRGGNSPARP
jgi:hypothetical protein